MVEDPFFAFLNRVRNGFVSNTLQDQYNLENEGLREAPSHMELHELPLYSIVIIKDEQKENDAREVFISYLEAELSNIYKNRPLRKELHE